MDLKLKEIEDKNNFKLWFLDAFDYIIKVESKEGHVTFKYPFYYKKSFEEVLLELAMEEIND